MECLRGSSQRCFLLCKNLSSRALSDGSIRVSGERHDPCEPQLRALRADLLDRVRGFRTARASEAVCAAIDLPVVLKWPIKLGEKASVLHLAARHKDARSIEERADGVEAPYAHGRISD